MSKNLIFLISTSPHFHFVFLHYLSQSWYCYLPSSPKCKCFGATLVFSVSLSHMPNKFSPFVLIPRHFLNQFTFLHLSAPHHSSGCDYLPRPLYLSFGLMEQLLNFSLYILLFSHPIQLLPIKQVIFSKTQILSNHFFPHHSYAKIFLWLENLYRI